MDLTQRLLGILNVYKDNSELISSAVKDLHFVGPEVASTLKKGLENRRRKLILKAIALLAPSDIPAKVVEVDGVDDAELLVLRDQGHLEKALAIYFRHDDVSQALFDACASEFDEGTAFYTHSILAAAWDCVELGVEGLVQLVKPKVYECGPSARKFLENARQLCTKPFESKSADTQSCKVLVFEASRDDHRRFSLTAAVVVSSATGCVFFYDGEKITLSDYYTLDPATLSGLNFEIGSTTAAGAVSEPWTRSLTVLCSMFAEVHNLPDGKGVGLVNSVICRLEWAYQESVNRIDALTRTGEAMWIPTKGDLKQIHNKNDDRLRLRFQRTFTARQSILDVLRTCQNSDPPELKDAKLTILGCISNPEAPHLGRLLIEAYRKQTLLSVLERDAGRASVFATYIYSSLGKAVVAEEYREIYSSRKVNICQAKSGTQVFVPHSGAVTMTIHGMDCKSIQVFNSQIFPYDSANRFVFLPHLLEILGVKDDDAVIRAFYHEMDENAYLVADPMTANVRAAMVRYLEQARKQFRVSTLHEDARRVAGPDDFPSLVREAISLLSRLGATVPPEYVGRSCFYDVTREIKGYNDYSTQFQLLFDRGVIMDRLGCTVTILDRSADKLLINVTTMSNDHYVIAPINRDNLRRKPVVEEEDEELRAIAAAMKTRGLVCMRPEFEIFGQVHLAVTRSKPEMGIFALFSGCEARGLLFSEEPGDLMG